ncbi:lipid A biosynthesis lauroyl acyltransferase [Ochrobactrum soli]|uniref:Lipid A biosynthesis lauroyl acyltransferase n=2 Tax=Ochrobactrum TaxID=528 RepID=A0ABD5JUI6_9HYPH|nr:MULTISPECIES: lipid A biosynthesis lauroyl acyltransferase [Brucella]RRD25936.1 lipid A biosynthesis lauroyl acyltransferase [Brucellaceae bacterium VT-16-1752]WHT42667.1 lipid A biosynthesis lauroyl acyltransferase [Ochrobactrum sp. SSR]MDX4072356.1 lipid A biosynthesis lauroyl acyltransferase [Brucella sp. NBRC 113783]NNU60274.1 lipid A biosynthesis lauroyl acyltransferase [[Ochrobactrum] soli]RLL76508.1 lipid A biosynthesis lauroyl acyltransferase [[Ochrobactrum] soli]
MMFKLKLLLFRWSRKLKQFNYWLWAQAVFVLLGLLRLFPAKAAISFSAKVARLIGPLTPRHKIATNNLRQAYPGKSDAEIEVIARDMWDSMARLLAEYIFLDAIFDFDPNAAKPGLIEVDGIPIFERLRDEKKPHIFFTAHTGNFELLPICAATFGLNVTALFRPPNNPYIANKVLKARHTNMGHLVPSKAGAAWALAGILGDGGNVGMLVDQKFSRGVPSTFFNRPVKTNPLLAKLARQYDCDVYPARCIRLPGGRYRLELYERMELPRDDKGQIDIDATAQLLNDTVEQWVREYPGQWMWFHKRWG